MWASNITVIVLWLYYLILVIDRSTFLGSKGFGKYKYDLTLFSKLLHFSGTNGHAALNL